MERARSRAGESRGKGLSKLFRVLVAGGIALAAGCATTQGGKQEGNDGGTSGAPPAAPQSPAGTRGW